MTAPLDRAPVTDLPANNKGRDRTHWLYLAVIFAVIAGVIVGPDGAVDRKKPHGARDGVRQPDQDDDRTGHLLHDRARDRLGAQSRGRGQGRRAGFGLLSNDVIGGARDRVDRRQPTQSG